MSHYRVFTSEAVCVGHPDRLCDIVSDSILDQFVQHDPTTTANITVVASAGQCSLFGEVESQAGIDVTALVCQRIGELGYITPALQFTPAIKVHDFIRRQSPLSAEFPFAATGFACKDGGEFLPLPFVLARHITRRIDAMRASGMLGYLRPDTRVRVSMVYKNSKPLKVSSVTVLASHNHTVENAQVQDDIYIGVIEPTLYDFEIEIAREQVHINSSGPWHLGGPAAQAGVSGRLIAPSGYGGFGHEPLRALYGQDSTRLPRAAAYAARFVAKNIIAAGLAYQVEATLHYENAHEKPQLYLTTFNTGTTSVKSVNDFAQSLMDLTLPGCIDAFKLRTPHYAPTAVYGHFGNADFPWEQIRRSV